MRLICHIGTPKTASTLIQNSFAANRPWLADRGISYPNMLAPDANHITLFFANAVILHDFARDYGLHSQEDLRAFRTTLDQHIKDHINQLDPKIYTVVMSSENLTGNMYHPDSIVRLKELLTPHFNDIKIVVYVRRQDDAILSMYGEFMRRGFCADHFRDFVDMCLGPYTPTPYLYYRKLLSIWLDVWGKENLIVRRYAQPDFIDGDILSDFIGIVQNTWEPDLTGFTPSKDANHGLSAPSLEYLRRMHPQIPYIKDGNPNPNRAELAHLINQMPTHPRPVMGANTARLIMQHFGAANTWLRDTFFPKLDGPFFPDRPDHPEHGNMGHLTPEEITELTGHLLSKIKTPEHRAP